jgi:hypothetical protein
VTVYLRDGQWLFVDGQLATGEGCCCNPDGACCIDGECSTAKEADCIASGGIWQGGGTTCDDGDCASTCCIGSLNDDGCAVTRCEPGYFFCNTPCYDPELPQPPSTGQTYCLAGTGPPHTTVTGSGASFNTGDAALDALLSDGMNASYDVGPLDCDGGYDGPAVFPLGSIGTTEYEAQVSIGAGCGAASRYAAIAIYSSVFVNGSQLAAVMERNEGSRGGQTTTSCGDALCDCSDGASGPPTSSGGWAGGNFSNADITTS